MYVRRIGAFVRNKDRTILMNAGSVATKIEILKRRARITSQVGNRLLKTKIGISLDRTTAEPKYFKEILTAFNDTEMKDEANITNTLTTFQKLSKLAEKEKDLRNTKT